MVKVTKDSGQRINFESGMQRDVQDDKPAFGLLYADHVPYAEQMITRWASLLQRGAVKYAARNWEQASSQEELNRFKESAARHFNQWMCEEQDEDHAAAIFFNVNGYEVTNWKKENGLWRI